VRALAVACAIASSGCGQPPLATVAVDGARRGPTVPAGFAGFSVEYDLVLDELGGDGAPNEAFRQTMRNLGASTLRVGGNSEDDDCWSPDGTTPAGCRGAITPEMARAIFSAVDETGWRAIVGVNLAREDAQAAATYVRDGILANATAKTLAAVEIGNEPDVYVDRMLRPPGYSEADHRAEFLARADAIAALPDGSALPLSGPAVTDIWSGDLASFPGGVGQSLGARLAMVTAHWYPLNVCSHTNTVSVEDLLSSSVSDAWRATAPQLVAAAGARPLVVDETNSVACGGQSGTSDAFAAALWALDFLFTAARAGVASVQLHAHAARTYSPILVDSGALVVRPLYYALALFASRAEGRTLVDAAIDSTARVLAFAVTDGQALTLFLLNEDARAGEVVVRPSPSATRGSLLLLQAPALDDVARTTLGGATVGADGTLAAPAESALAPDGDGAFHVQLPVAAAAALTLTN